MGATDQLIVTLLSFVSFQFIDLTWTTSGIAERGEKETRLWAVRESYDKELTNMREGFYRIMNDSYGPNDLFVSHFSQEIGNLTREIQGVAEKRELRVEADHFLSVDNVLGAFHEDDERIWRYTWPVSVGDRFFENIPWRRYFEKTAEMAKKKKIKEIKAILVIEDATVSDSSRFKKLLDFFRTNPGMDCVTVKHDEFLEICRDNGIAPNYLDFGIYGHTLLFRTVQYDPVIIGDFTRDQALIERYIKVFETIWDSPGVSTANPSTAASQVTIQELYAIDGQPP